MKTINDMLIQLKNAQRAGHSAIELPYSKFRHEIAKALERTGYVGKIERRGKRIKKILALDLIDSKEGGVQNVRLLSKASRHLYTSCRLLKSSRRGGTIILSTSKGVMSEREAKQANLGGELIAEIW